MEFNAFRASKEAHVLDRRGERERGWEERNTQMHMGAHSGVVRRGRGQKEKQYAIQF
jgi:hypothetical protein